ncbi:MAG: NAD(P)H-dependent oxidoreductase [Brevinema sp.]
MKKVTVILAHENLNSTSVINKAVIDTLKSESPSIQCRNLDSLYPDFKINIEAEQQALIDRDIIVMQFPVQWYHIPAIMKQYIDKVWSFGWAFGPNGDKLKGKKLYLITSTGSVEVSYSPDGKPENYNKQHLKNYLFGIENAAHYMGVDYKGLFPIYSIGIGPDFVEANKKLAVDSAHKFINLLQNDQTAEVVIK